MNNIIRLITFFLLLPGAAFTQRVGIGVEPDRAILEVQGAAGAGSSSGIFGSDRGISLQRKLPAIGFNQYQDDSTGASNGRYLGTGYAALISYRHVDPTLASGLDYTFYATGAAEGLLPAGTRVMRLSHNNRMGILVDGNALLDVARSTGADGTAFLQGTSYSSYFNYSTAENTYIRSGQGSNVYLNDITSGKVIFGDGAARVGLNTSSPVYAMEIRQVANTGIKMTNSSTPSQTWEWRVAGSPTNFYAYYAGAIKTYFSPTNGSLNPVSDERLKQNISPLPSVLEALLQLRPVRYEMISDNPHHVKSIGFLAQEVLPLFPQLVYKSSNEKEDLMLEYSGFGVIAIKGIQEEEVMISNIEKATNNAEQRILEIEKKIAAQKLKNK